MKIEPKEEARLKRLATRIASELFLGFDDTHATRLILAYKQSDGPERLGGGWCEKAVYDVILRYLLRAAQGRKQ